MPNSAPTYGCGKCDEEWSRMRHGISWMGAIVALCSFTASHAEDTRENDPVAVTRSFLGAWATSSVDELLGRMADDAVVVLSSGARLTGEPALRRVFGGLKGLQNRDVEVRLDGDRVSARGKTYGYVPYVDLGVEPGEWDSSTVVKNGRIARFSSKPVCKDYVISGTLRCPDFAARAKAHTEARGRRSGGLPTDRKMGFAALKPSYVLADGQPNAAFILRSRRRRRLEGSATSARGHPSRRRASARLLRMRGAYRTLASVARMSKAICA